MELGRGPDAQGVTERLVARLGDAAAVERVVLRAKRIGLLQATLTVADEPVRAVRDAVLHGELVPRESPTEARVGIGGEALASLRRVCASCLRAGCVCTIATMCPPTHSSRPPTRPRLAESVRDGHGSRTAAALIHYAATKPRGGK